MNHTSRALTLHRVTYAIFQDHVESGDRGKLIALTSPGAREGVSYVARLLCRELGSYKMSRVLYCAIESLAHTLITAEGNLEDHCIQEDLGHWTIRATVSESVAPKPWDFSPALRKSRLDALRSHFDYTILDCPAVTTSSDILGVTQEVDSILLVVGAGMRTRKQIVYAQRLIEEAGGVITGCILNRRTYPIPDWIYRVLKGGRS